jgi:hypothetical protein
MSGPCNIVFSMFVFVVINKMWTHLQGLLRSEHTVFRHYVFSQLMQPAEVRVRSHDNLCGISRGQRGTGTCVFPTALVSLPLLHIIH